jgi:tetratricopeptide (TPR) repeat protein
MHAIRLDDAYGPAYRSLGYLLTVEGDYDGAMRAYDRSISLGTHSSWGKAMLLSLLARHDVAIDEYREAVAQDPLSVPIRWQLVQASYCAGRYAEVIDGSHSFLSIEPDNAYAAIRLAIAYVRTGNLEEGLHLAEEVAERIDTEAPLAVLFALAGQDERARAALDALERNEPDLVPWALVDAAAPAAIALGENDRALDMIERVIADAASDPHQTFDLVLSLRCTPEVRSLAGHPRYDAILDRLGLPS